MVDVRYAAMVVIALVAIAIPAYATTILFGWVMGAVVAVSVALGIAGGRWAVAQRQGGGQPSANRSRRRQSKGAQRRER